MKAECTCWRKATHVIFDLDGTLVDTEKIYGKLFSQLVGKFGKTISESLKLKYLGSPSPVAIRTLIEDLQLPVSFDEMQNEYRKLQNEMFNTLSMMEGVERLIRHFHRHNIPMAIATSSDRESAHIKLSQFPQVYEMLHHVVTAADIVNGKPAPDIYLLAASKFADQPEPELCLAFEDAPNGVKAAIAAGMQCVLVPDPALPEDERKEATLVLHCLVDFQPEMFGLPPFDK